ncbi:general L-amino acid transport system permease protein [Stella humosa]|uniref:General L-amino acid transport system permease protein n=1 Tax=Stella humosa TaxID=94 RepID=A0A3N1LJP9_9PROT|nr:amino acid ABC transporter permease [Stella humosa]ROP91234.1 general L-amino acid transport system permease protein [Stella humosa]BBK34412.1 amino acid ABC transporter permease [Stella humosa]
MTTASGQTPPLVARSGPWRWVRTRLFRGPVDTAITLACLYLLWLVVPPLLDWLVLSARWMGESRDACTEGGACWVFIRVRFDQFMYGFYPEAERWRVNLAGLLVAALVVLLFLPPFRAKKAVAIGLLAVAIPGIVLLLSGGVLGLRPVETRDWGGLMVTVFMALYGAILAVPVSLLLALGRQSKLPVVRVLSIVYVEFWRGVPIIAIIFLASNLLPLIVPAGVTVDKLARALIGLALVISAYMAEVIRGGLLAIPKGQYEAARSLGLGYWTGTTFIILPQAIRIVIPSLVNEFIALFKNTTLVLIVSLFDLLGMIQSALTDPKWVGLNLEGYVFAGVVFWIVCFAMSRWSQRLELRLARRPN